MNHLHLPTLHTLSQTAKHRAFDTSLLYQLFSTHPTALAHETLMLALETLPNVHVNETDHHGRSLLLNHLGYMSLRTWGLFDRETLERELSEADPDRESVTGESEPRRPIAGLRRAMRLLDLGADPWVQDEDGRDVLDQAMHLMWVPLIERLLAHAHAPGLPDLERRRITLFGDTLPLVHACVAHNNLVLLDLLIAQRMNLDARDDQGRTPLFLATSVSSVERLLKAGANVGLTLENGQDATMVWARASFPSATLIAMQRLVAPYQQHAARDNPQAFEDRQRSSLYHLVETGTKDNVIAFMRQHGFDVDDHGLVEGRPQRLIQVAVDGMFHDSSRSLAILTHLLERSAWMKDDTLDARNTLFRAWLGGLNNEGGSVAMRAKFLSLVEQRLETRYRWSTVKGMVDFMNDFLPWVQTMIPAPSSPQEVDSTVPDQWALWGHGLLKGLDRTLRGTVTFLDNHKDLHSINGIKADTDPNVRMYPSWNTTTVYRAFIPSEWVLERRPDGISYAWWWASMAANVHLTHRVNGLTRPLEAVGTAPQIFELLTRGDSGLPAVPADAMAINAMMAAVVVTPSMKKNGQNDDSIYHGMLQHLLQQGPTLDPTLPHHEHRLGLLRQQQPLIAQAVERHILNASMHADPTHSPVERPARARL